MATLPVLRRRIKSVSSTRQITKAMELVASSKLRRAQTEAAKPKDYAQAAGALVASLGTQPLAKLQPLFSPGTGEAELTVVIAGDQGLAGPYNSNIYKAYAALSAASDLTQQIITIGKRPGSWFARFSNITELMAYEIDETTESSLIAQAITEFVIKQFTNGEAKRVQLIYTQFETTTKQSVQQLQLLPQTPAASSGIEPDYEAGFAETVTQAITCLLHAQLTAAISSSRAAEQSARMLAMMNATNNASDLIEDLTLCYNNARQGAITAAIAEITTGAEAITH